MPYRDTTGWQEEIILTAIDIDWHTVLGINDDCIFVQNILLPELRASGRAFIEVVKGLILAGTLALSGWLLDLLGEDLQTMMLLFVPTTMFLAALVWIPLYKLYPRDLEYYKAILRKQRDEIMKEDA